MVLISPQARRLPRISTERWTNHLVLTAMMVSGAIALRIISLGVHVSVIDGYSDAPVAEVTIAGDGIEARTGADGVATAPTGLYARNVVVSAPGYRSSQLSLPPVGEAAITLERAVGLIEARDSTTGQPVPAAQLLGSDWLELDSAGRFQVWPADGRELTIVAPNHLPTQVTAVADQTRVARLRAVPHGVIVSATTGEPLTNAVIASADGEHPVKPDGTFQLPAETRGPAWVLAPGYQRQRIDNTGGPTRIELRPQMVKGLYLSLFGVADETIRSNVERLAAETEINAVVVDVKGDRGFVAYPSSVPLAQAIGANEVVTVHDIQGLLDRFKANGIYTIARIVVFKDDRLAHFGPAAGVDVAVRDGQTGQPWVDGENLAWVDPFREEAWAYNIALAEEAASLGFDEIQFDYIRFPTDPSSGTSVDRALYSRPSTELSRTEAIGEFLRRARVAVHRHGAYLGIDTFGYTPWAEGDMGIGQLLEIVSQHVDYVCPMVYPSTFGAGLPGLIGFPAVVGEPHRVVYESSIRGVARVHPHGAVLRPWLQYFDDYPWQTRRRYDAQEIRAQIRAAAEAGGLGWMLWDPSNRYNRGGLERESR